MGRNKIFVCGMFSFRPKAKPARRKKILTCGSHLDVRRSGSLKKPIFTCYLCNISVEGNANLLSKTKCPKTLPDTNVVETESLAERNIAAE